MDERFVETSRLRTRLLTHEDAEALAELFSHPGVNEHLPWGDDPLEEARENITLTRMHWSMHGFGPWALESRETNALVGRAGLGFCENGKDVHYACFLAPQLQKSGVATELIRVVFRHAFRTLKLPRFFCYTRPENKQAQVAILASGMLASEDRMQEGLVQKWFVLEADDWEKRLASKVT